MGTAPLIFRSAPSMAAYTHHDELAAAAPLLRPGSPPSRHTSPVVSARPPGPPSSLSTAAVGAPVRSPSVLPRGTSSNSSTMICFNCLNFGQHRLNCPNEHFLGCHRCLTLGHVSRDCLAPRPVPSRSKPLLESNAPSAARRTSQALYAGDNAEACPPDSDTSVLAPAHA